MQIQQMLQLFIEKEFATFDGALTMLKKV